MTRKGCLPLVFVGLALVALPAIAGAQSAIASNAAVGQIAEFNDFAVSSTGESVRRLSGQGRVYITRSIGVGAPICLDIGHAYRHRPAHAT